MAGEIGDPEKGYIPRLATTWEPTRVRKAREERERILASRQVEENLSPEQAEHPELAESCRDLVEPLRAFAQLTHEVMDESERDALNQVRLFCNIFAGVQFEISPVPGSEPIQEEQSP